MFKKIYNLVFSAKQLDYQRQAYAALSFWESYRGWLALVFIISWAVSIWIFALDLRSVLFLAPVYGLIVYLSYTGRAGAMVLLLVFWLLEKFNNLHYLFFDYYKLAIVVILGLIFFPLAFNALKVEFSPSALGLGAEGRVSKHRREKVFLVSLLLLLSWLITFLAYHYYPFITDLFKIFNKLIKIS